MGTVRKTFTGIVCHNLEPMRVGDTTDKIELSFKGDISPFDTLAGASIRMQLRVLPFPEVHKEISTAVGGIVITDEEACEFEISEFLCELPVANYSYDIEFTYPNGEGVIIKTWFKGFWPVFDDITKPTV